MKTRLTLFAAAMLGFLSIGPLKTYANLEVGVGVQIHAVGDFDTPLAAEGGWINCSYGRCWHPARVAADWRPYCDGTWVWTDAGWYWQSDEPWAWACYHYGRWVYDPDYGWIWTPDVEWAPAWVYWRTGGGHIGWAPCPPRGHNVDDAQFVFVENAHFQDHLRPSAVIINNAGVIRGTKLITKVSRSTRDIPGVGRQKVVINNGPGIAAIQKATGKKFTAVPIHDAASRTHAPEQLNRGTGVERTATPSVQRQPDQRQPAVRQPEQRQPDQRQPEQRQPQAPAQYQRPAPEQPSTPERRQPEQAAPKTPPAEHHQVAPAKPATPPQKGESPDHGNSGDQHQGNQGGDQGKGDQGGKDGGHDKDNH